MYIKGSTHITNSKEARIQRRQDILDENEYYKATEGMQTSLMKRR